MGRDGCGGKSLYVCVCVCGCVCEGGRGGINKPLTQNTKALKRNSDLLVESTGPGRDGGPRAIGQDPLVQVEIVD